ncbi:trihelix transcription factor ASIL2-like [Zingiber officinale]|uniref:Myb-like domain-containing protein n=1 Tax=Zingiber officinale TaxID=94328 RepID=A0A8J5KLW2_ZINOF|nr:trihelix transcription factor ASIL2-like [Zingiber officinale]KAG6481653.1 hypothetical protein ZIOFF_058257 [Zingiber officinale]
MAAAAAAATAATASSLKRGTPSSVALAASAASVAASPSPSFSPSPPPDPGRSPSPFPPPPSVPSPPPSSFAAVPSRRLAAPIWTQDETLSLIDAYREKWYALRRGNLRANHWQEVAEDISGRCSSGTSSPKTAVQCRHKVEKLRRRYRSERHKSLHLDPSLLPASSWIYFRKMDAMEHGGNGGVGGPRRPSAPPPSAAPSLPPSDNDDDDQEEERGGRLSGNSSTLHRLMGNGGGTIGELRFKIPKAVRSKVYRTVHRPPPGPDTNHNPTPRIFKGCGGRPATEGMWPKVHKKIRRHRMESESSAIREMISAVRMLGDGFLRIEQMKMEMAREIEKLRMEMELERTELILDTHRRIVDALLKGVSG